MLEDHIVGTLVPSAAASMPAWNQIFPPTAAFSPPDERRGGFPAR